MTIKLLRLTPTNLQPDKIDGAFQLLFLPVRPNPDGYPDRWIRDPTGETVDNGEYDILRPGVMLRSGRYHTARLEYDTTSGVLVEDCLGEQYMTVSSHGFPNGGRVFHQDS
ncbi:hypothetical protein I7I51_04530 [Histoplasma capsulatum]|uniref:Uncharacterized protein n=1 Tax=Ajellomyces capsulatus TaxID=5037 RepID=A0A8A1MCX1_AJECA|nr:hypothetical protein I7I51_04530 [Histoplasma capsulatum]